MAIPPCTNTCKLVHVLEWQGVHELLVGLLEQAGCGYVLSDQRGCSFCVAIGIDVHAMKRNTQETGFKKAAFVLMPGSEILACRAPCMIKGSFLGWGCCLTDLHRKQRRMKSHKKNTSSGSQFPIWFSEREKIQGILTSLEKSQLYDLETGIKKAL